MSSGADNRDNNHGCQLWRDLRLPHMSGRADNHDVRSLLMRWPERQQQCCAGLPPGIRHLPEMI